MLICCFDHYTCNEIYRMAEFNEKTRAIGLSIIFCNGHNRFNLLGNKLNRLCPLQKIIESLMRSGFSLAALI